MFKAWDIQKDSSTVYLNNALAVTSPEDTIPICHVPAGKSAQPENMRIIKSMLNIHLAHGDKLGDCAVKTVSAKQPEPKPIPEPKPEPAKEYDASKRSEEHTSELQSH